MILLFFVTKFIKDGQQMWFFNRWNEVNEEQWHPIKERIIRLGKVLEKS